MKKIMIGLGIVVAFATPSFAQSYSASYGTGNVIDMPLLEKTNGAYGYAGTVPPETAGSPARASRDNLGYAYSPRNSHQPNKRSKLR